ncbi:type II toxin-antitoxin system RelE/ParE family toxin [Anaerobium acetethylicum]|uniref:ParE toxin of type II toxin-antitoxin system, parDE n=1 Tax=Anaerobium acetethylicum TaxID=1619234 RepID=A0A1D3TWT1_9FIRM|nr:type II toxin-antitoxin system RelE/ParE family toxin [Anaerobium acetethylicum]SCP98732.1 hypothetical protein SAMN05421730_102520 [Anaerobium acetethylicum]
MYKVEVSPAANGILEEYALRCLSDNGEECALRLLDSYDQKISFLESEPLIGCARLRYVPSKYRVLNFWPHLWFVFQIKESENCVKIDYIIDDRQNYGAFLR